LIAGVVRPTTVILNNGSGSCDCYAAICCWVGLGGVWADAMPVESTLDASSAAAAAVRLNIWETSVVE
jgi:hypothetical protein